MNDVHNEANEKMRRERYYQTLVDLIIETATQPRHPLESDDGAEVENPFDDAMMTFFAKALPNRQNDLNSIAYQINERLGINITDGLNIKKLADDILEDDKYISRTYQMVRYNNMKTYEKNTIDKIIEAVEKSRDDKIKMFINHIIKCIQEHQASSMQTIVYDVMVRRRMDDDKKDIMLFIQHNQLSRLRGKVCHSLEDIEDIVNNATITATNVDEDFKEMFENTREVKSERWESNTSYYNFKKPYTKQELKTLLRKIYNDNKNQ